MRRGLGVLSLRVLRTLGIAIALAGLALPSSGCTSNSIKKQYLLAEKLWADGKYASAVLEFDKVSAKDSKGKLGTQALYRSATTQMLFLSQYAEAERKFKAYTEAPGGEAEMAWDAQKQIGEILFAKTDQYDRAIQHYATLLKLRPETTEVPEFRYRIAKSHFFLWHFDDAVLTYRQIIAKHPGTTWAEKAAYEIGVTYFTRGERKDGTKDRDKPGGEAFQEAIEAFQGFVKQYPSSTLVPQAKFGVASCLEELDQLDAAYDAYESLKTTYPSPKVIAIKLARIREREAQRSR